MNATVLLQPDDETKEESIGISGEIVQNTLNELIIHPFCSQYKSVYINNNSAEILSQNDIITDYKCHGKRLWNDEDEAQIVSFEYDSCLYINAFTKQDIVKRSQGSWSQIRKDERGMICVYSPHGKISKMTFEFYYKHGKWNVEFISSEHSSITDISDEGSFANHFYRVYSINSKEYELSEITVNRKHG